MRETPSEPVEQLNDIADHPLLRAAELAREVHQETLDKINAGLVLMKPDDNGTGQVDVTAGMRHLAEENIAKLDKLISEVKTEGVFTTVAAELICEMGLPTSDGREVVGTVAVEPPVQDTDGEDIVRLGEDR